LTDTQTLQAATFALAADLIARPSVTPEDGGCLALIADRLKPLGFDIEFIDRNGVTNLWARRGRTAPLICLAGHVDVVPTGPLEKWSSAPFVPTVREGRLYGRGAADMKGSVAAMVIAVEALLADRPDYPGSIAFLLTSDEEGIATDGTVAVVETLQARGQTIDYCIIGEPSSSKRLGDTVKVGRRGSLSGRLVVKGVQGHVAYPELVKNPIHFAAPALASLAGTVWDQGNEFFPPTSFQVSNIRAGTGATNVVPGELEVLFNFRFSTASTPESLRRRTEDILGACGLPFEIEWTLGGKPFLTGKGKLVEVVRRVIAARLGVDTTLSTSGGTSDGRFIADLCPELVELGPVNDTIHKIDENVLVEDLGRLAAVYRDIVEGLA
jgi:succinyl-diaminopimelate desuccinylase